MGTACVAPETNLYLFPNGEVRVCCYNTQPLGLITEASLSEIWAGAARRDVIERLAVHDFSAGCHGCESQLAIEGREASYPAYFDTLPREGTTGEWPIRIEFNLSNTCNLQCIQCNGELSSSIRHNREHRPPAPRVYDDRFFDDLRRFVPHLRHAQFAGGEPFLAAESYRVWDLVAELNPDLDCIVVTNATQWNRRVRDVVERLRMSFVFSIDGMSKETYESIRIGADFAEVLENVERFREVATRKGTTTSINHCLMRQNYRDFGALLLYAEERSMPVTVSVVRDPTSCSIAALPADRIGAIHEELLGMEPSILPHLDLNADVWRREVDRIAHWATADPADLSEAVVSWTTAKISLPTEDTLVERSILGFPTRGQGPTDDSSIRAELEDLSRDGAVESIAVDRGSRVTAVTPGLCALLGVDESQLVGGLADHVRDRALTSLGEIESFQLLGQSDDRMDASVDFPSHRVRVSTTVIRDERGIASEGRILIAFLADDTAEASSD